MVPQFDAGDMIFLADVITIALFVATGWLLEARAATTWADKMVSAPGFGIAGIIYVIFRHWEAS